MWLKLKVKAEDRWQRKKNPSPPSTAASAHTPKTLSETHASVRLKVIGYAHVTGTEGYVDVMLKNNLYTIMKSLKEILKSLEGLSDIEIFVIDLFCGAGGLSEGVEEARLNGRKCAKVVCCVNHDKNAILSHILPVGGRTRIMSGAIIYPFPFPVD